MRGKRERLRKVEGSPRESVFRVAAMEVVIPPV
jgi:hypothetical protein